MNINDRLKELSTKENYIIVEKLINDLQSYKLVPNNIDEFILKTLIFSEPNIYGSVVVTSRLNNLYIQDNIGYFIVDGNNSMPKCVFNTLEEAKEAVKQDYLLQYKLLLDLKYSNYD